MVHPRVVLTWVVALICGSGPPEETELFLCLPASQPMKAHVHSFHGLGQDFVVDDTLRRGVVRLDRRAQLLVPQFVEDLSDVYGLAGIDEEAA